MCNWPRQQCEKQTVTLFVGPMLLTSLDVTNCAVMNGCGILLSILLCNQFVASRALCDAGKQSLYQPLDIFSYSTCELASVGTQSSADQPVESLAKSGAFSKSLLMTTAGKNGQLVQLMQKSVRL